MTYQLTHLAMKVFIYARKSTDDRVHQVLSIDTQLFELRNLAVKNTLTIIEEITEEKTARVPGRPGFNELIDRLINGEAEGILCWKLHRLARNFDDGGKVITLLQTGSIKAIHTLEKVYTPQDNVLLLAIEFGIATQFSKDLSKDVTLGLRSKLRNGGWPALAPVGYLNDKSAKTVLINPRQARLVTEAFTLFATGDYRTAQVLKRMSFAGLVTNRTGKPLSRSNFDKLLRNPFYYGTMRYGGELTLGRHDPLITKATFDRVQSILADRHRPRSTSRKPFLYRGLFRCATCGCLITMEIQKGHTYLRCTKRVKTCNEKYLREEAAHAQITDVLNSLDVPDDLPTAIQDFATSLEKVFRINQKRKLEELRQKESLIAFQNSKLLSLFLSGTLIEPEFLTKKNELVKERSEIREAVRHLEQTTNPFEPAQTFIEELNEAIFLKSSGALDRKRDFLKKVGSNLLLSSGALRVELKSRWKAYLDWKHGLPSPWAKIPKGYQLTLLSSLMDRVIASPSQGDGNCLLGELDSNSSIR